MFADEIVENAWMRSHAQCECRQARHGRGGQCAQALVWERRGKAGRPGAWEVRRNGSKKAMGWEAVNQCAILCWECYTANCEECPIREDCLGGSAPFAIGREMTAANSNHSLPPAAAREQSSHKRM